MNKTETSSAPFCQCPQVCIDKNAPGMTLYIVMLCFIRTENLHTTRERIKTVLLKQWLECTLIGNKSYVDNGDGSNYNYMK